MSLRHRRRQPELMDDPSLDKDTHYRALKGLRRVNWWSRTASVLASAIQKECHAKISLNRPAGASLQILDIASGGGDSAIQLARSLASQNVAAQIDGCDISPAAVDYATSQAKSAGCTSVRFFQHDILTQELPYGSYDVVMCSLFMHHLDEPDVVRLFQTMTRATRYVVLVDDLKRSQTGYWMAWLGCRLLTRCHVVHTDGPLSVEGAFTVDEARDMAEQAGCRNLRISEHWPQRFLMTWSPS